MSVDSLGLSANNLNVSGAAGSAGKRSASTDGTGESMFQNLISQMLLQNDAAAGANDIAGISSGAESGNQTKANGISDLLAALLLGGGSLTKLNLENKAGETAETKEESGKETVNGGDSISANIMATLLEMTNVSGQHNANAVSQMQGTTSGIDQMISAIQAASHVKVNGAVNFAQESGQNVSEVLNPLTGMKATDSAEALQGKGSKAATSITEALNPMNQVQTDTDTPDLEKITLPEIQEPAVLGKKQNEETGMKQDTKIAALTEKTKQEIDGGSVYDSDYPGQLQAQGPLPEAVNGTVTQAGEKAEPYSQIGDQILAKLEQNGPKEFKMQLEPEDLGQIDIKLKLNDGKLMIDILAANSKTQALLTSQVDKLISSMGLQNVQVESVQVSQQMNSQSQDSQQNQGFFMNSGMDFSQRKNQEHFQQEFLKGTAGTGAFSQQQDEVRSSEAADRISPYRYASNRMNYAV
jgi:flagellar hook-length control protein FliK